MSKEETVIPATDDNDVQVGKLRFQKDYGLDEFHVHHDEKNKKFVFKAIQLGDVKVGGIRRYELAWEQFQRIQHDFNVGAHVVFRGDKFDGSHEACDLVFVRKKNKWKPCLEPRGAEGFDMDDEMSAFLGDETLTVLDEWMQRH